jgi:hypothetical protein
MSDFTNDHSRCVIKGVFEGDVFPGKIQQLNRKTYVEAGALVKGAILGGDIVFRGSPFQVEGAICSRGEVTVENLAKRSVIQSTVVANRSFAVHGDRAEDKGWLAVLGDVHSERANLDRCVVYGNVFADNVILSNCCVLGLVHARKRLEINKSMIGTYRASTVHIGHDVKTLTPYVASAQEPSFEAPITCLAFLNLRRLFWNEQPGELGPGAVFELNASDLQRVNYEEVISEGNKQQDREVRDFVLGPGARVLDSESAEGILTENSAFISMLVLRDLLDPRATSDTLNKRELNRIERDMLLQAMKPFR